MEIYDLVEYGSSGIKVTSAEHGGEDMIRNRDNVEPYVTKDRSTVWELYHPGSSPAKGCSVAEAEVRAGRATERHVHKRSQEIYYILEGSGTMGLGKSHFEVKAGDAVLIPPGNPHNIRAGDGGIRILCICTPPYSHDDTELLQSLRRKGD
jgi:mannose-6-phosphate isomerase-like protein (cupin superfamily)